MHGRLPRPVRVISKCPLPQIQKGTLPSGTVPEIGVAAPLWILLWVVLGPTLPLGVVPLDWRRMLRRLRVFVNEGRRRPRGPRLVLGKLLVLWVMGRCVGEVREAGEGG